MNGVRGLLTGVKSLCAQNIYKKVPTKVPKQSFKKEKVTEKRTQH